MGETDNLVTEKSPAPPEGAIQVLRQDVATAAGSKVTMKPAGRWAVQVKYDPDDGIREEDYHVPAQEYMKRYVVYESYNVRDKDGKETQERATPKIEAVLQEPVEKSQRWKPIKINSYKEMKDFYSTTVGKYKHFMEQTGGTGTNFGPSSSIDFDSIASPLNPTQLIDREFVPLMFGPFYKQLYIYDYLLMHSRAFNLSNHNALAAAALKIMTRFTLGRGISFHIKNKYANDEWTRFWKKNNLRKKIRQIVRDLCWQGEMLLKYVESGDSLALRVLDASTCWEVVTDPEDIEIVYYYHFQWPTPYQIWVSGQIPIMKYIIQQIPPTNIQHFKINVSAMEKRGRSDFMPSMSWLKRYDDYYNGQTVKAVLEANLVWKVKVKGDQADVDAFLANPQFTELPPPGSVWVENEAVDLTATSATLTASRGSMGIGQQIAAAVAVSMNLPSEYFNIEGGAGGARATALVRTDPAVKAIEDRQQVIREELEEMYERVISAAIIAGRIPRSAAREDPELKKGDPRMVPAGDEDQDNERRAIRDFARRGQTVLR